jgi:hypothetical protein
MQALGGASEAARRDDLEKGAGETYVHVDR